MLIRTTIMGSQDIMDVVGKCSLWLSQVFCISVEEVHEVRSGAGLVHHGVGGGDCVHGLLGNSSPPHPDPKPPL